MILKKQTFQYQNKTLIEKATVRPPYKHERVFQEEGCFMYVKGNGVKLMSSQDNLSLNAAPQEAVLLKCDTYFVDFIKETDDQLVEVFAIHLYADVLKKLYINELPALIQKQTSQTLTKRIVDEEVVARFIDSLDFYFENPFLVNDDLLELKIKELILLLVQTKSVASIVALITELYHPRTSSLKEVIQLHLYSNLTVEELAKLCQMSVSTFKRVFKKQFEDTPLNYLTNKKMEKAQYLLRISEMPISEITYEIGYTDPHYFARTFKNRVGFTPSSFRAQFRK